MVGRKKEISELLERYDRDDAQFVAVYGRRRVGKTYLIDETFKGRITFRHAGVSPVEALDEKQVKPIKRQLQAFYYSLISQGMKKGHCPGDWLEAFFMLEMFLQEKEDGSRQLIFLDELPWMDTQRSGFVTGLESFWNNWACHRNVMLIVSGSANSWIRDKLINNHGGLYGRVTREIKLEPFNLRECELLFEENGVHLSRYDIVQSYMIFGGIPYYLGYFRRGRSLAQNVDDLFFVKGAKLCMEYDRLFASVFTNPSMMKSIIKALRSRNKGCTRREIVSLTGYKEGGRLSEALEALIASDFIIRYIPFGFSKREVYYKLVDPFCIFYLDFIENKDAIPDGFWLKNVASHPIITWRGYAFENVCFNHISQIKDALGISGISTTQSAWTKMGDDDKGTQIDMIISRKDNIVNMCEMKYYSEELTVDKDYEKLLRHRQNLLYEIIPKKSSIHNTLVTTFGIKNNEYRWSFDNVITLEDLFK